MVPWADMSQQEYSQMHGLSPMALPCQFADKGNVVRLNPTMDPLRSLDYVKKGATTAVKDQGKCAGEH
eukprot:gene15351-13414_t